MSGAPAPELRSGVKGLDRQDFICLDGRMTTHIDDVQGNALEVSDLIEIEGDLVSITSINEDDDTLTGTSHNTGDTVTYPVDPFTAYPLFGA